MNANRVAIVSTETLFVKHGMGFIQFDSKTIFSPDAVHDAKVEFGKKFNDDQNLVAVQIIDGEGKPRLKLRKNTITKACEVRVSA